MAAMRKMEIELPEHLAREVDRKVESGQFSDVSAVITDALDGAVADLEAWIAADVMPTIERMDRDGPAGLTGPDVFGAARERYLARKSPA